VAPSARSRYKQEERKDENQRERAAPAPASKVGKRWPIHGPIRPAAVKRPLKQQPCVGAPALDRKPSVAIGEARAEDDARELSPAAAAVAGPQQPCRDATVNDRTTINDRPGEAARRNGKPGDRAGGAPEHVARPAAISGQGNRAAAAAALAAEVETGADQAVSGASPAPPRTKGSQQRFVGAVAGADMGCPAAPAGRRHETPADRRVTDAQGARAEPPGPGLQPWQLPPRRQRQPWADRLRSRRRARFAGGSACRSLCVEAHQAGRTLAQTHARGRAQAPHARALKPCF
jgi:hypothetical protein